MREVIQKVIAAEAEARRVLAAGRSEADRVVAEAQKQARELVKRAGEEARAEAGRMLDSVLQQAEQQKRDELAQVAAVIEAEVRLDESLRRKAIEAVIRCVCATR